MTLTIRPFNYDDDADYYAAIEILNKIRPDKPTVIEQWKFWDSKQDKKYMRTRLLGEQSGRVVAFCSYGETPWSYEKGKFFLDIQVDPALQGQGLGTAVYNHIMTDLAPHTPHKFISWTEEDQPNAVQFLTKHGFEQVMRYPISHLAVQDFDGDQFQSRVERMLASGVGVKTMAQLLDEMPDVKEKFYEAWWEMIQDIPMTEPITKPPLEKFVERNFDRPDLDPAGWFLALDGDNIVGTSQLYLDLANDKRMNTALTAVKRTHRRQSIAFGLKVCSIRYAKSLGKETIETDNEENNPMYDINMMLGFQPKPAALDFTKAISR